MEAPQFESVFLHVTKACNLSCSYCYFSASKPLPDEMTTAEFSQLWPDVVALTPKKLIFTGGEPLLRPDLIELVSGLAAADPEHRILRCVNSNGHGVTKQLARDLVGLADEVRVSLDGLPGLNDAVRGPGNFDAALRALEIYHSAGFVPKVLVTVTAMSLPGLEELLCFLIQRGITRINLNAFRPIGRGQRHVDWQPDPAKIRDAVRRAWRSCYPASNWPPLSPDLDSQSHCGVGRFINIMSNGDVFPCHVLTNPEFRCGNLRQQRLVDICRSQGLLAALATLDFSTFADDKGLSSLTNAGTCLGSVYARTKTSPSWGRALPLVPVESLSERRMP